MFIIGQWHHQHIQVPAPPLTAISSYKHSVGLLGQEGLTANSALNQEEVESVDVPIIESPVSDETLTELSTVISPYHDSDITIP